MASSMNRSCLSAASIRPRLLGAPEPVTRPAHGLRYQVSKVKAGEFELLQLQDDVTYVSPQACTVAQRRA